VVGITTAVATVGGGYIGQQSGSIGVGFAIPIGTAYRIATQLISG
jgi:putative serine protease PepD